MNKTKRLAVGTKVMVAGSTGNPAKGWVKTGTVETGVVIGYAMFGDVLVRWDNDTAPGAANGRAASPAALTVVK